MLFNSFEFLIFLPLAFSIYWFILQKSLRFQNVFILFSSYVFYGWWDWRFLSLIFLSSMADYFSALEIYKSDNQRRRKFFLWLSITLNLGLLGFFKYFNFFGESFADLMNLIGLQVNPYSLNIILPVGISFYTFQTMSYTIDVYRQKMKPTKDTIAFFSYVSFFPQLVAGPIERAVNLLPQFYTKRKFSYQEGVDGLRLILWGLFKKVVIADSCAPIVNTVFANYETTSGLMLTLGVVLFAFQIYGDFSGYSDIAIGTAQLLGFKLMTNFKTPYFSRDIAEFWRRWHISLSTWFRDYVYIPLGGNRTTTFKAIRNTTIIFAVSGFWHGANWTFIIWGLLNAIYFLPLLLSKTNRKHLDTIASDRLFPSIGEAFKVLYTFCLTCFAWIFFRATDVGHAYGYLKRIYTHFLLDIKFDLPWYLGVMLVLWLMLEWLGRNQGVHQFLGNIRYRFVRYVVYYVVVFCILFLGTHDNSEFIYFQF